MSLNKDKIPSILLEKCSDCEHCLELFDHCDNYRDENGAVRLESCVCKNKKGFVCVMFYTVFKDRTVFTMNHADGGCEMFELRKVKGDV